MSFGLFADFLNSCFSYFSLGFCFSLCNSTGKRFRLYFDRKAGCGSLNCKFLMMMVVLMMIILTSNNSNNDNDNNTLYT